MMQEGFGNLKASETLFYRETSLYIIKLTIRKQEETLQNSPPVKPARSETFTVIPLRDYNLHYNAHTHTHSRTTAHSESISAPRD